ncbi:L-threonine 3-dehydrogenase [Candidatus Providencia siddallii]|uniref:L-threonine 3-dehydrogenase n=1 Tax=Candidatus Providencia siddallii TaxID=1715285 RepID=A0A0M6WAJ6_9GAMM|nr:L-threonine 3-dehydrogenase [Candidatus Providencia siddallii]
MKVLSKLKSKPGIWMTKSPKPKVGRNDVMIKISKTAICGTDIHIYNWDEWAQKTISVPIVIGHEYVGEIVEIGDEVKNYKIGDRVSGEGHIICWNCRNCRAGRFNLCKNTISVGINRPGCFAEFLVIPAFNVFKIPENISDEIATIFDPFGNAVNAALSFDLTGEDVLILGAGPIGIMSAIVCRRVGARNVVIADINNYRLELAKKNGISETINVSCENILNLIDRLGLKDGFGVVLEVSGSSEAFKMMLNHISHGGCIASLGIPKSSVLMDWNQAIFKGISIKCLYGRRMFETWYKVSALIQLGVDLSKVITHEFFIDDFQKGFDVMSSGLSGKVILKWD